MTDLSQTIAPKSDQLNADDLISGARTITVTKVSASPSSPEQPVSIFFEGDNGKPFKPCKSMRRVLVQVWGKDGNTYAGRSMTLYRDPAVLFGGIAVGGIRISHMTNIDEPRTMALTASKASRKPFTVKPLKDAPAPAAGDPADRAKAEKWLASYLANPVDTQPNRNGLARLQRSYPDLYAQTQKPPPADDWASGPDDSQMGEAHNDADPFRAAADRLIAMAKAGEVFSEKDAADLDALPDALRAEVDAACETV